MTVIIALYNISIVSFMVKFKNSQVYENIIAFIIYENNSNNNVDIITIPTIVILLSFEKFLSRNPPNIPIAPYIIDETPTFLLIKISISNPNITPNVPPYILPANSPINKTRITIKFGFTPAIVNQEKRFVCNRYIKINVKNNAIPNKTFFNLSFTLLFIALLLKLCLAF